MGLTALLNEPFYLGSLSSTDVPGRFPIALGGRPFVVDFSDNQFIRRAIRTLRNQADTSTTTGEHSLSRDGLWRAVQESWHRGAGQTVFDREESDPFRFRSSKGIDVWTKWEFSMLPATDQKRASVNTNLQVISVGAYCYISDGNEVRHTQDITVDSPTFTDADIQAGEGAQSVQSITSDGFNVWAALGTNGVHTTERGAVTSTHYNALQAQLVGYVKGRLMAAKDNAIYNVTASGAAPAALLTHPNTDFRWQGFAEGLGSIYAAGFSGDKSIVFRTAVKADGTALDVPVVAGELPDGEIIRSIQGYLGFLLLGTDKGVRFAIADNDAGDLTIGGLIPTDNAVRAFEGQDRFVWAGWTNYDGVSTGLMRLDLSQFPSTLTPAYASDLMVTAQGNVLSIATFQDRRVFTVSGSGVHAEDSIKVSEASIDSGFMTFGVPDQKVAMAVDVRHNALVGSHSTRLSADGSATFSLLGTHSTPGETGGSFAAERERAEKLELKHELTRSSTDTTQGPVITRSTLKAYPAPARGRQIQLPIIISNVIEWNGLEMGADPEQDLLTLEGFEGQIVSYQEGSSASQDVLVEDVDFIAGEFVQDQRDWALTGLALVTIKIFPEE